MSFWFSGEKIEEKKEVVEENNSEMKEPPEPAPKKPKIDMASLPTRQYLDQTVVPILLQGLSTLSKERYVYVGLNYPGIAALRYPKIIVRGRT